MTGSASRSRSMPVIDLCSSAGSLRARYSHRSGAASSAHCGIRAAALRRIGSNHPGHVCRGRRTDTDHLALTIIPIAPVP
jgi:hypothetical protein